ncbi:MAG: antitoxin AF2212-like protein [candidate division KSB1 bacterium]
MSQLLPAVYSDGVFKPLKPLHLPLETQTYYLIVLSSEEVKKELTPVTAASPLGPTAQLADLVAELKTDLAKASLMDFNFDEEHQRMFLDNAESFAPLIPSMSREEQN